MDRKQELQRLLAKVSPPFPLRYADHVDGSGTALFQRVCELDLEGIVAKQKFGPYVTEREHSTMVQDFESEIFAEGWQGGIVREGATQRTCPRLAFVCVSLWSCLEFASGGMQRAYSCGTSSPGR